MEWLPKVEVDVRKVAEETAGRAVAFASLRYRGSAKTAFSWLQDHPAVTSACQMYINIISVREEAGITSVGELDVIEWLSGLIRLHTRQPHSTEGGIDRIPSRHEPAAQDCRCIQHPSRSSGVGISTHLLYKPQVASGPPIITVRQNGQK